MEDSEVDFDSELEGNDTKSDSILEDSIRMTCYDTPGWKRAILHDGTRLQFGAAPRIPHQVQCTHSSLGSVYSTKDIPQGL